MFRRGITKIVDVASRHPLVVLFVALGIIFGAYRFSQRLELRSDFLELLPRDSPGFIAFEHQLGRVGGGATLIVVNESPDRKANEHFVDELGRRLQGLIDARTECLATCPSGVHVPACKAKCPELISYMETGTKEVRQFFDENKWLYADLADLEAADKTLDNQIALSSGLVEKLDDDDSTPPSQAVKAAGGVTAGAASAAAPSPAKKPALGMDEFRDRWKSKANEHDDFPTGYFATPDGLAMGVRIVTTSNLGDATGDSLLSKVKAIVEELQPSRFHPQMKVGFAGDVPNAAAEKESLLSEAAEATLIALVLILGGVIFFFRSVWSLFVIALPVLVGVTCAYAFATATYGYVNTSGAFLGAIILGNGINYPIVLLARYREFRARGMEATEARREAVINAFRAELVGALVAGIAYGSLTITRFRGFNQFGVIGFVGMILVWASIVPLVPALIVLIEALQARLPRWLRDPPMKLKADGSQGTFTRLAASATERAPWFFVVLGVVATIYAAVQIPPFLKDPWEYDFSKLGSKGSMQASGAGDWSNKADRVFGGKMNIAGALMLADTPEQVPALKAKMLANDALDPQGRLIADIATIDELMPGAADEQKKKLDVLDRIRDRLTPAVMHALTPDEKTRVQGIRPPETLKLVRREDLPLLMRRRFTENNGAIGTVFYVKVKNEVSLSDGHNQLRIAKATDNVVLEGGTLVKTASRSTVFAEMIRSMERDGPLATFASFGAVVIVVILSTSSVRGAFAVILALVIGVIWTVGGAAHANLRLNYVNFIALPITFGIGCEYPFNIFDRSRILKGNVSEAVRRSGGAVILCSYTTAIGYGSLMYSDFQALESFGKLAVSGEIACLFAAIFFLPALLHLLGGASKSALHSGQPSASVPGTGSLPPPPA
jgi:uncharacterized protein